MSTGNINLDIILNQILDDAVSGSGVAVKAIRDRYPSLSESEAGEICALVSGAAEPANKENVSLVATAPPSFAIKALSTRVVVEDMLMKAQHSITITGYALSDYFDDLVDTVINKSQKGVFVKFFLNKGESQSCFEKLNRYKGRYLKLYNYPQQEDSMSALHAKVISVDKVETLITSANLSYHGQEGNIELGAYIVSDDIGKQVDDLFTQLIFKNIFTEV